MVRVRGVRDRTWGSWGIRRRVRHADTELFVLWGGRGFRVMGWRFGVLYDYSGSTLLFYYIRGRAR